MTNKNLDFGKDISIGKPVCGPFILEDKGLDDFIFALWIIPTAIFMYFPFVYSLI